MRREAIQRTEYTRFSSNECCDVGRVPIPSTALSACPELAEGAGSFAYCAKGWEAETWFSLSRTSIPKGKGPMFPLLQRTQEPALSVVEGMGHPQPWYSPTKKSGPPAVIKTGGPLRIGVLRHRSNWACAARLDDTKWFLTF
jgi:hypothetical protein